VAVLRTARVLFAVFTAALVFPLAAQVVVEEEDAVVTNVVDLFDIKPDNSRSVTAAMAMSVAVPGSGHYYIDRAKGAYVYLALDAASIFAALLFNNLSNGREREARSFAHMAAGIESAPSGEAYWRHVGAYMDAAEYNEVIELSRGGEDGLYTDTKVWWHWADESQQDEYNGLRQKARDLKVVSSFFIGALVLNRLVSVVDLRVFRKKSLSGGVRFDSALAPDMSGAALTLKAEF